ncbi:MAG: hypothetical protein O2897_04530 [bacterium]|nr:hypothetical protein [bacterium]
MKVFLLGLLTVTMLMVGACGKTAAPTPVVVHNYLPTCTEADLGADRCVNAGCCRSSTGTPAACCDATKTMVTDADSCMQGSGLGGTSQTCK